MALTVATYNVLASAYIEPGWYPLTPPHLLRPEYRIPALVEHVLGLDADMLCLQEVEDGTFAALDRGLSPRGYTGKLTSKGRGRPDGCAIFVRKASAHWASFVPLAYHDAAGDQPASGHVAQILALHIDDRVLGIANTHLKWDPPNTPPEAQFGYRQIAELLEVRASAVPQCSAWIICGDLNVTVDSDVVGALRAAGLKFSHMTVPSAATCNANRSPKMIDYLFYDAGLEAEPLPLPEVRSDTPLPGPMQPSDHVAVLARFHWVT